MAISELLCMNCMEENAKGGACPYCGYDEKGGNLFPFLPQRTLLQKRYLIGKMQNFNGEGATYIGYDAEHDVPVRIREYLPDGLFERVAGSSQVRSIATSESGFNNGLIAFLDLARTLARMKELTGILPIYDIFEDNGTAYYISETVESVTLRDYLLRSNGSLSFEQVRPLFLPLLSTLNSLHAVEIIHRAISPETLLIGKDGKLRLTDFCIAEVRTKRTDYNAELYKGFAAIEQYGFDGQQGPWTDIYGLAATIYRVLVGNSPPEATARVTNDKMMIPASVAERLPAYVMSALENALQILPEDRTPDIDTFRDEFSATPTVLNRQQSKGIPQKTPGKSKKTKRKTKGIMFASLIFTCIAVVIVLGIIYFIANPNKTADDTTTSSNNRPSIEQTGTTPDPNQPTDFDKEGAPSLVGFVYGDFMSSPDKNLSVIRNKYVYVIEDKKLSTQKRGTILSQSPPAGTLLKNGDTIKLVLSMGSEDIGMPNLVGMSYIDAYIALLEAGFAKENIKRQEKFVSTMPPATVVGTDPKAAKQINVDTVVTIFVNSYVPTTEATTTETTTYDYYNYGY